MSDHKNKKHETDVEYEQKLGELTQDLQRTRADFENYRKRVEAEKRTAEHNGATKTVLKLLPVIDTVERAVVHIPQDIVEHQWVQGVAGLVKQLDKTLADMNLKRIDADKGTAFDPELHQAIQFDEEAKGEKEVVAEELQPGYLLNDIVIRPALVKVTKK